MNQIRAEFGSRFRSLSFLSSEDHFAIRIIRQS